MYSNMFKGLIETVLKIENSWWKDGLLCLLMTEYNKKVFIQGL